MVDEDRVPPDRSLPGRYSLRSNSISAGRRSGEAWSAETSGDNGIAGSFELRFDQRLGFRYLTGYRLYGFADARAGLERRISYADGLALTSAGAGVQFFFGADMTADIAVAFPLSYRAPDNDTAVRACCSRYPTRSGSVPREARHVVCSDVTAGRRDVLDP